MTPKTPASKSATLWEKRLALLKKSYAIGLQILTDAELARPKEGPDRWKILEGIEQELEALTPSPEETALVKETPLGQKILKQARANENVFRSLKSFKDKQLAPKYDVSGGAYAQAASLETPSHPQTAQRSFETKL